MTIVSTIITADLTVHAADSLLTLPKFNALDQVVGFTVYKRKARKIVRVRPYAGAMSYWGLARLGISWTTHEWLEWQVGEAKGRTAEQFAHRVAEKLQDRLSKLRLKPNKDAFYGIGIHFTVYEDGIPELFLITNYLDPTYEHVDRTRVHVSRQAYLHIPNYDGTPASVHSAAEYRQLVKDYLAASPWHWIIFNNGDPGMFNPVASSILDELRLSGQRANLDTGDRATLLKTMVTLPIDVVSKIQQTVLKKDRQLVGAPVRWLAIRPVGIYESKTGD